MEAKIQSQKESRDYVYTVGKKKLILHNDIDMQDTLHYNFIFISWKTILYYTLCNSTIKFSILMKRSFILYIPTIIRATRAITGYTDGLIWMLFIL